MVKNKKLIMLQVVGIRVHVVKACHQVLAAKSCSHGYYTGQLMAVAATPLPTLVNILLTWEWWAR